MNPSNPDFVVGAVVAWVVPFSFFSLIYIIRRFKKKDFEQRYEALQQENVKVNQTKKAIAVGVSVVLLLVGVGVGIYFALKKTSSTSPASTFPANNGNGAGGKITTPTTPPAGDKSTIFYDWLIPNYIVVGVPFVLILLYELIF